MMKLKDLRPLIALFHKYPKTVLIELLTKVGMVGITLKVLKNLSNAINSPAKVRKSRSTV
jgi:hypothetical protein